MKSIEWKTSTRKKTLNSPILVSSSSAVAIVVILVDDLSGFCQPYCCCWQSNSIWQFRFSFSNLQFSVWQVHTLSLLYFDKNEKRDTVCECVHRLVSSVVDLCTGFSKGMSWKVVMSLVESEKKKRKCKLKSESACLTLFGTHLHNNQSAKRETALGVTRWLI